METMESNSSQVQENDVLIGVLSYLSLLWIVAYFLNAKEKSKFASFHIRQGLGILSIYLAVWAMFLVIGIVLGGSLGILVLLGTLSSIIYLALLVLIIIGIYNVLQNKTIALPVVGKLFEQWFAGL
jgi:uncharacterized membrane protein